MTRNFLTDQTVLMTDTVGEIPGIPVLVSISKETTVTNRGPQRRTPPLRNHCLNLHRLGLGAELGIHTSLKTWLPLYEQNRIIFWASNQNKKKRC